MKRIINLFFVILLCCAAFLAEAAPVQIDIYSVNDLHGRLRAAENTPGAARLAAALNLLTEANPKGTLIVGGGDMLSGSIDADSFDGLNAVEAMNIMGFAANCAGNHAFDYNFPAIVRQAKAADFPLLAANITDSNGNIPAPFAPYAVVKRNGIKTGIIGVLDEQAFKKVKPDRVAGLKLTSSAEAANKYAVELRRNGVQVVVLLAHIGGQMENGMLTGAIVPVLDNLKGIDAVASGDSHTVFACSYKGIPAVQAGEYGRQIGHIKLFYDTDAGEITQAEANVYETGALTQERDSKAAAFLQPYFERVDAVYSKVLAYNTQYLANEKYGESPLADYFMDLINSELQTDITLYNGGAIRSNLPAGNVTLRELKQIFPFNNTLYVVRLRGSDILKALEHGLGSKEIGRVRFAGLTVTADLSVPEGGRLISVQLADGSMLNPERYYSVAVNDFLLSGGDGYTSVKGAEIIRESGKDLDVLSTALKKAGQINFDYNNKRFILK